MPPHDQSNMSELSIEYQSALEREKDLSRKYEELFGFLSHHVKNSQVRGGGGGEFVSEVALILGNSAMRRKASINGLSSFNSLQAKGTFMCPYKTCTFILTPSIAYKFTLNYIGEKTWLAKLNLRC